MKNIKLISFLICSIFCLNSCTIESEDDNGNGNNQNEELSTAPLTGQVYGENFSVIGGTARFLSLNGEDVIRVSLYDVQVSCTDIADQVISLNLPREVGVHQAGVTGSISDPNSSDFLSLVNIKVEVLSFDNTEVSGRVLIDRPSVDSFVNGTFTVQFCM